MMKTLLRTLFNSAAIYEADSSAPAFAPQEIYVPVKFF